jgi:hypothetical protein
MGIVDVKRFRTVAARLFDSAGNNLVFFESGESLGTGAITSVSVGGRHLTGPVALGDGDFHEFRLDASGRLLVNLIGEEISDHDVALTALGVVVGGMHAVDPGGTFGVVSAEGDATRLRASLAGIQYAALTNSTGSSHVSVVDDNAAAPGTPAGMFVAGIFRTTLPTYTNGDAVIPAFDSRGRLLVSPGESGLTADIDTDQAAGPATPAGQYIIGKREATLPTYADQDNSALHLDLRGRLIVSLENPTSGNSTDIDTDDSAAATNPTGIYALLKYQATLPTYTDLDAVVPHADARGRTIDRAAPAGVATRSNVAGAAADTLILSANTDRIGGTVFNDSASDLFLSLGTGAASSTSFTKKLTSTDNYFEIPGNYTGEIRGRWASAARSARITELTT